MSDSIYLIGQSDTLGKIVAYRLDRGTRLRERRNVHSPDDYDEDELLRYAWGIWRSEKEPEPHCACRALPNVYAKACGTTGKDRSPGQRRRAVASAHCRTSRDAPVDPRVGRRLRGVGAGLVAG
ncbi:MAG: hypothetical protein R2873_20470 [Caldilineaceae bacterium]